MTTILLTCDRYDHLVPGCCWLLNRYWPEARDLLIMHFRPPPPLPAGFARLHQIAPVETKLWSTHIREAIEQLAPEVFTLVLDDYWLLKRVDPAAIQRGEQEIQAGAAKFDLSYNTRILDHTVRPDGLFEFTQTARYRTSLQPAIWTKKYFLQYCKDGRNIWQFETIGYREAMRDGAHILGFPEPVFDYANIYHKGQVRLDRYNKIPEADRAELERLHYTDKIKGTT